MSKNKITAEKNRSGEIVNIETNKSAPYKKKSTRPLSYTQGDSDVITMPAGFRRHLVGKTLINVCFHCGIAEIRFVGKLVIVQPFS